MRTRATQLPASNPGHRVSARAFTLVEIMVVVVIISVLTAIGLVIANRAQQEAFRQKTKAVLHTCMNILSEYRTQTGNVINAHDPAGANSPINWSTQTYTPNVVNFTPTTAVTIPATGKHYTIQRFLAEAMTRPTVSTMITHAFSMPGYISSATDVVPADPQHALGYVISGNNNGFAQVIDAWGTPIRFYDKYTKVGSNNGILANYHSSGSITFDDNSATYKYNKPFFVSAGPDLLFGDNLMGESGATAGNLDDNLTSLDIK